MVRTANMSIVALIVAEQAMMRLHAIKGKKNKTGSQHLVQVIPLVRPLAHLRTK